MFARNRRQGSQLADIKRRIGIGASAHFEGTAATKITSVNATLQRTRGRAAQFISQLSAMARSISRDSDLRQNRLAKGDSRHQWRGVGYQFSSRFGHGDNTLALATTTPRRRRRPHAPRREIHDVHRSALAEPSTSIAAPDVSQPMYIRHAEREDVVSAFGEKSRRRSISLQR